MGGESLLGEDVDVVEGPINGQSIGTKSAAPPVRNGSRSVGMGRAQRKGREVAQPGPAVHQCTPTFSAFGSYHLLNAFDAHEQQSNLGISLNQFAICIGRAPLLARERESNFLHWCAPAEERI